MIKIEDVETYGWEAAIRGMRNPMNSWDKSDSGWTLDKIDGSIKIATDDESWYEYRIGPNDQKLMKTLAKAGSEESKFRRMIHVQMDITAPLYWISELDTYKVGTVRNSCSFMHKGLSKAFDINDFSIKNEDVYTILNPLVKEAAPLTYSSEPGDYRVYTTENGREYKIYENGRIMACPFSYTDNYGTGRIRNFEEHEVFPSVNNNGYYYLNIGGRFGERWLLHRLIATVWIPNPNNYETVNHIDGNKGNNAVCNLEWCAREDNIQKSFDAKLHEVNRLHGNYAKWKNGHKVSPEIRRAIIQDHAQGIKGTALSEKYHLPVRYINNVLFVPSCKNSETFEEAYIWEKTIETLNKFREACVESKDNDYFQELRRILPSGYNQRFTFDTNYEVLANIYRQRRHHRLDEWRDFCKWIETLPFSEIITGEEENAV